MFHIIDGNNLAGTLKMLSEKNFDKNLAVRLKDYYRNKTIKVFLVFDGHDPLGDKSGSGLFTIIYSPKDKYYQSADDKIVEILNRVSRRENDLILITSDRELIRRAQKVVEQHGRKLEIIKAEQFAAKLMQEPNLEENQKEELSPKDTEKINQELLDLWT